MKAVGIGKTRTFDKIKREFFEAVTVPVLLYSCTTWTLRKRLAKKLDEDYTKVF